MPKWPGIVRPGRRRDQHIIAVCRNHLDCILDGLHAATGDKEILGAEGAAIVAGVIIGERLAQFRNATLPGVEGFALQQAFHHGSAEFAAASAGFLRPTRRRSSLFCPMPYMATLTMPLSGSVWAGVVRRAINWSGVMV